MNWTQPLCCDCWHAEHVNLRPIRIRDPEIERCCKCGKLTDSGIYLRIDPRTVPYPTEEED